MGDELGTVIQFESFSGGGEGPWTDPWGPDFKALYRGDGMLLLSVTDGSSLSSTHIFSLWWTQ